MVALVVSLAVLIMAATGVSMVPALTAPGTAPVTARIAEWARGAGLGGLVNIAERLSYRAPRTGGRPGPDSPLGANHADPNPGATGVPVPAANQRKASGSRRSSAPKPKPPLMPPTITPVAKPPISGEDHWHIAAGSAAHPALAYTFMRPDAVHTSYTAAVTWFDPQRVRATLHPGAAEPGAGHWGVADKITDRSGLIAAFNSGFKIADARGGYYENGHYAAPLRNGAASFVIDRNGRFQVVDWGRDTTMNSGIAAVRQNLRLLVDHGRLAPGIASNWQQNWGATVGNQKYVWRSGVGERADGTIVNVVGPALSAKSLAILLKRAGAVRGMELDINTDWTSFVLYHGNADRNLLPDMFRSPYRYDTASERDFVTLKLVN
ncbi:MAG: phosphodiester glycosidase family protein [Microlunatus sp.]|nr:phosphodiester glycosidase family protein [Microlunatus sp.]